MSAPFDDLEASRKLPADVLAYVADVETFVATMNAKYGDVPMFTMEAASTLCAIVRGQHGRTMDLEADNRAAYAERDALQNECDALRERLAKLETALTHALNDLESAIDVIDAEGIEEDAIDESRVWLALTRRELLSESAKDEPT